MQESGPASPSSSPSWSSTSTCCTGEGREGATDSNGELARNYRLERWHTGLSLAATRNLGLLTLTAGLAATLYYFYTHIAYHEDMFPIAENSLIAGVWSMMCVKWGFALSWSAHQYKQVLDREYSLI